MAGALQIILLCVIGFAFGRFAALSRFRFFALTGTICIMLGFGPAVFIYRDQLPESLILIAPYSVILLGFPWLFASIIGRILRRETKRSRIQNRSEQAEDAKPDNVPS